LIAITSQPSPQALDRIWFKFGAACLILGTVLFTAHSFVHQPNPNDNAAVFAEYAADNNWLATHMAQFSANFLIVGVASFAIHRSLIHENENAASWSRQGILTAAVCLAVFTVDQRLDGVALKRAVDAWAGASADTKAIYFGAAESIRWLEYALNGMYNITLGMFVLFVSLGMTFSSAYPKWLGWTGVVAGGLARAIIGVATLSTGFSPLVGAVHWMAFLGGTIWRFAVTYFVWKMPNK
jgi:hypothetical protein